MFVTDLDVFRALDLTDKAMAESFFLKQIDMKAEAMKSELKLKDEAMKSESKLKEEVMKVELKGMEEAIASDKILIEMLNKKIIEKDLELYRTNGRMNLRSMFELMLHICVSENPSRAPLKTVSEKIDYIMSLKDNEAKGKFTKNLRAATEEYGCDLHKFRDTISQSIHVQHN